MNEVLYKRYEGLIDAVDDLFSVSTVLKTLYEKALNDYEQIFENVVARRKGEVDISRAYTMLKNIKAASIERSEEESLSKLRGQALILVVSITEVFLDDLFKQQIKDNLFTLKTAKDIVVPYKELVSASGSFDRDKWTDLILDRIYGEGNPAEKLNLQNAKQIEYLFKGYFGVEFNVEPSLYAELNFFYQARHVLVHRVGKIDKKFLDNIKSSSKAENYKLGDQFVISEDDYITCKRIFKQFIFTVTSAVESSV